MRKTILLLTLGLTFSSTGTTRANPAADNTPVDLLIEFKNPESMTEFATMAQDGGAKIETLGVGAWIRVKQDKQQPLLSVDEIRANPNVASVQPNYPIRLPEDYRTDEESLRARIQKWLRDNPQTLASRDNPAIPNSGKSGSGADPLFRKQWGMSDIGAKTGWKTGRGAPVVVAVIDTGTDYTHEDLIDNLWRNPGETGTDSQGRDKATNKHDDDGNGFVDDVIGWDFVSNDNKPYDQSVSWWRLLLGGGNPGHGTHCAGNIAARAENGRGIAGVAPEAKIMTLRFLSEKGAGTTADAIKSIRYAVNNGAKVLSNSWGSEGEDSNESQNKALRDAIQAAQDEGVLFIAAAGNGHMGRGYDNDTDRKPAYPASYDHENIISVAALDSKDELGSFSNWGAKSVDIGAPGVKVYSTTVGSKYNDLVVGAFGVGLSWDGTSMAAPHVAGAAAVYWSANPNASWREVKQAILESAKSIPALKGKVVSGGKLNVTELMKR